jgi:hypothetical protein
MKRILTLITLAALPWQIVAAEAGTSETKELLTRRFATEGGKYQFTLDATVAPDLMEWAQTELAPVVQEWYPKLVAMLPGDGFEAPTNITIRFRTDMGRTPASAGGGRINCNADWFKRNLKGEARGSVVHEMVHLVQSYGRARRNNPDAKRTPGWLVEGVADYIRWFLYEPEVKGAEITERNFARAKHDASYRITGNFLNWVTEKYDKNLVPKLNAAAREGKYDEALWKEYTGSTLAQLGEAWRAGHEERLAAARPINALSEAESKAGWKLLFNGNDLSGWSNFKTNTIRPGWQAKDGLLVCADPKNAGDLCTREQFGWFELQLDYNISPAGNSGIMYHVTDEGRAAWATGPEVQLEDNQGARDPQRCGWLYALYQPADDPKTGKPLDTTKPAGEWNRIRLVIAPDKCEHYVNGFKYLEYVLGSDDFAARVAKSKFSKMPQFAKSNTGYIVLQGDHGRISFRNIKVRPIEPAAQSE